MVTLSSPDVSPAGEPKLLDRRRKADREYWLAHLAARPAAVNPLLTRERPPNPPRLESSFVRSLPAGLSEHLERVTGGSAYLRYIVFLTVLGLCLRRYSGSATVMVGSPARRKKKIPAESSAPNVLALCLELADTKSLRELLIEVREVASQAFAHQSYPFRRLIRDLGLESLSDHCPLFDIALVCEDIHQPMPAVGHDLTLSLRRVGTDDAIRLEYATVLFQRVALQRFAGYFTTLLSAALEQSDVAVERLRMLPPGERQQVLVEWNDSEVDHRESRCLHEIVEQNARRLSDTPAVIHEEATLSYGELDRRANRLAHGLRSFSVRRGTVVGICMDRSLEMAVGLLGILKAGAAFLPLEATYPEDYLARVLADGKVALTLVQSRTVARLTESSVHLVVLPAGGPEGRGEASAAAPETGVKESDLAYVIYTSGSTGRPKGVMIPHRGIRNRLLSLNRGYPLTSADRVLQNAPLSFDVAVKEIFWALLSGATAVLAKPEGHRDPTYLARLIRDQRITANQFVPSMLRVFLDEVEASDCTSLRLIFSGGEALTMDLQQRFYRRMPGGSLHNFYGPTEASVGASFWDCDPEQTAGVLPIGRPINNTRLYILSGDLNPVPTGLVGELCIAGAGLARGYLGRPIRSAGSFVPHPFSQLPGERLYRTADLARYQADGTIEFLGRRDHQVKLRGFRIELGDVEAALRHHPEVSDAVAVAHRTASGTERLVAYVVNRAELDTEALREALVTRLPPQMIPAAFLFLPSLPRTQAGKIDRKVLPEPKWERAIRGTDYVAPQGQVEQMIAEIWQELLEIDRVGSHDNFFELGGHSLLLVKVRNRLAELGRKVDMAELLEHTSIAALSRYLSGGEADDRSVHVQSQSAARERAALKRQMLQRRRQQRGRQLQEGRYEAP